jgi:hypothetical protein
MAIEIQSTCLNGFFILKTRFRLLMATIEVDLFLILMNTLVHMVIKFQSQIYIFEEY